MKKILGLDLGTNSIGWAIVEDGVMTEMGTKVVNDSSTDLLQKSQKQKLRQLPTSQKLTLLLFVSLTCFIFIDRMNWQFWLGLSITTLLTHLTMKK